MANDDNLENAQETSLSDFYESLQGYLAKYRRPVIVAALTLSLGLLLILLPEETLFSLAINLLKEKTLLVLLMFFSLLTISLLWSAGEQLDVWVFLYFNQHILRTRNLDRLMWVLTQLGNGLFALILALVFFLLGNQRLAITIALGVITLWLVVETIKALTDRARPFLSLAETRVVGWREIGRSFPSGHTSQSFFLVTLFVRYFMVGAGGSLALYGIAVLVGFTRIYVGVHYPRDVLAGAILGSVWGILGIFLLS